MRQARALRYVVFPPETIILTSKAKAQGVEVKNPLVICAQSGLAAIDALGGYLAAWACSAEPGATLTIRCVEATEAEAAVIAAADNPPREFDHEGEGAA